MGKIVFSMDAGPADVPVSVTFKVPKTAVDRIVAAFSDYYGEVLIVPGEPEKGMRARTEDELIDLWARKCMSDIMTLVQGYETRKAAERAMNVITPIEFT